MQEKNPICDSLLYIEKNLKESMTVKQIADAYGYSQFHFARLFRKKMGMSVMDYVKKKKLQKALEEISAGKRILDVALEYGWQSHSGFTKSFQKEFGFSPALLRAMTLEISYLGGSSMRKSLLDMPRIHATKEELLELLKHKVVAEVILAGLFCDAGQKVSSGIDGLKEKVPYSVAKILEQLEAAESPASMQEWSEQVLMIKLAERLHNMRTIEFLDEKRWKEKALETVQIFTPLAKRTGNERLVAEMYELGVKYM